jgi:hypothetical protein
MKAYWGSGDIAPFFDLGIRWSGQLHASAALLPGKDALVPIA